LNEASVLPSLAAHTRYEGSSGSTQVMDVAILESRDALCDAYIRSRSDATICHTFAWSEMIVRAFGHRAFYLVAREGPQVRGVLPLIHVRSRLFGNLMVSGAFGNYGGPLADDAAALDALYHRAVELAREQGCESIEFRNVDPLPYDLQLRTDKVCMRLPLPSDPDELWRSFKSDTKVRNHIRKADKAGIVTETGGLELLDEFYELYAIRMRQLGTPCYSRRLMHDILETFPQSSRLFIARLGDVTVAVRLAVCYGGLVESCWGVTHVEYNRLSPNHALYWAALKHYCLAGAACFDFGRSTVDTGPYLFKKQWGTQLVQLHYQYWVRPGHELSFASPDNPKYKRRIRMWKKLPLCVTRLIGPRISRGLP